MPSTDKTIFEKPYIVITSTGRTGTHFLGTRMSEMVEGCTSVHEPDVIMLARPHLWPQKVSQLGLFNATVGKVLVRHSLVNLGLARVRGSLSDPEIVHCMRRLRLRMLSKEKNAVLIEGNGVFCSLVELLPRAFPNVRVVYIIRDPREWITSWINRAASPFTLLNIRRWFRNRLISPFDFEDDPYRERWKTMGLFEKLCWWWAKRNSLAVEQAQRTGAMVCRFEDLFGGKRDEAFPAMLRYVTSFPDGSSARWEYKPELFSIKTNVDRRDVFPVWREWDIDHIRLFDAHCRELMERFGYGNEQEWKEKISSL